MQSLAGLLRDRVARTAGQSTRRRGTATETAASARAAAAHSILGEAIIQDMIVASLEGVVAALSNAFVGAAKRAAMGPHSCEAVRDMGDRTLEALSEQLAQVSKDRDALLSRLCYTDAGRKNYNIMLETLMFGTKERPGGMSTAISELAKAAAADISAIAAAAAVSSEGADSPLASPLKQAQRLLPLSSDCATDGLEIQSASSLLMSAESTTAVVELNSPAAPHRARGGKPDRRDSHAANETGNASEDAYVLRSPPKLVHRDGAHTRGNGAPVSSLTAGGGDAADREPGLLDPQTESAGVGLLMESKSFDVDEIRAAATMIADGGALSECLRPLSQTAGHRFRDLAWATVLREVHAKHALEVVRIASEAEKVAKARLDAGVETGAAMGEAEPSAGEHPLPRDAASEFDSAVAAAVADAKVAWQAEAEQRARRKSDAAHARSLAKLRRRWLRQRQSAERDSTLAGLRTLSRSLQSLKVMNHNLRASIHAEISMFKQGACASVRDAVETFVAVDRAHARDRTGMLVEDVSTRSCAFVNKQMRNASEQTRFAVATVREELQSRLSSVERERDDAVAACVAAQSALDEARVQMAHMRSAAARVARSSVDMSPSDTDPGASQMSAGSAAVRGAAAPCEDRAAVGPGPHDAAGETPASGSQVSHSAHEQLQREVSALKQELKDHAQSSAAEAAAAAERLNGVQHDLAEAQARVHTGVAGLDAVRAENDELQRRLAVTSAALACARRDAEQREAETTRLEDALESKLEETLADCEQLRCEVTAAKAELHTRAELNAKHEAAAAERLNGVQHDLAEAQARVRTGVAELAAVRAENGELQRSLAVTSAALACARRDAEQREAETTRLEDALHEEARQSVELRTKCEAAQQQSTEAAARAERLSCELERVSSAAEESQRELEAVKATVEALRREKDALQLASSQLVKSAERSHAAEHARANELESKLEETLADCEQLRCEVTAAKAELHTRAELNAKHEAAAAERLNGVQHDLAEAQARVRTGVAELAAVRAENGELQRSLAVTSAALACARRDAEQREAETTRLEDALHEEARQSVELRTKCEAAQQQSTEAAARAERLSCELERVSSAAEESQRELEAVKATVEALRREKDALQLASSQLVKSAERSHAEERARARELESKLGEATDARNQLERDVSVLKEALSADAQRSKRHAEEERTAALERLTEVQQSLDTERTAAKRVARELEETIASRDGLQREFAETSEELTRVRNETSLRHRETLLALRAERERMQHLAADMDEVLRGREELRVTIAETTASLAVERLNFSLMQDDLVSLLEIADKDRESLDQQRQQLESRLQESEDAGAELKAALAATQQSEQELKLLSENRVCTATLEMERARVELHRVEMRAAEVEQELRATHLSCDDLARQLDTLAATAATQQEEALRVAAEEAHGQLRTCIAELRGKWEAALRATERRLQEELAASEASRTAAADEAERLRCTLHAQLVSKEGELEQLRGDLREMTESHERELSQLKKQLAAGEAAAQQNQQCLEDTQQRLHDMKAEAAAARDARDRAREALEVSELRASEAEAKLANVSEVLSSTQEEARNTANHLEELRGALAVAESQQVDTRRRLQITLKQVESLEMSKFEATEAIERLQERLQLAEDATSAAQQEARATAERVGELQRRVDEGTLQSKQQQQKIEVLAAQRREFKERAEEFEHALQEERGRAELAESEVAASAADAASSLQAELDARQAAAIAVQRAERAAIAVEDYRGRYLRDADKWASERAALEITLTTTVAEYEEYLSEAGAGRDRDSVDADTKSDATVEGPTAADFAFLRSELRAARSEADRATAELEALKAVQSKRTERVTDAASHGTAMSTPGDVREAHNRTEKFSAAAEGLAVVDDARSGSSPAGAKEVSDDTAREARSDLEHEALLERTPGMHVAPSTPFLGGARKSPAVSDVASLTPSRLEDDASQSSPGGHGLPWALEGLSLVNDGESNDSSYADARREAARAGGLSHQSPGVPLAARVTSLARSVSEKERELEKLRAALSGMQAELDAARTSADAATKRADALQASLSLTSAGDGEASELARARKSCARLISQLSDERRRAVKFQRAKAREIAALQRERLRFEALLVRGRGGGHTDSIESVETLRQKQ